MGTLWGLVGVLVGSGGGLVGGGSRTFRVRGEVGAGRRLDGLDDLDGGHSLNRWIETPLVQLKRGLFYVSNRIKQLAEMSLQVRYGHVVNRFAVVHPCGHTSVGQTDGSDQKVLNGVC